MARAQGEELIQLFQYDSHVVVLGLHSSRPTEIDVVGTFPHASTLVAGGLVQHVIEVEKEIDVGCLFAHSVVFCTGGVTTIFRGVDTTRRSTQSCCMSFKA